MKAGVIVPQGWTGEYHGWEPQRAWQRSLDVARQAERLGFDSIWAFDHFHTTPDPTDELTLESFTFLTALSQQTSRVRIGHIVICAGFRNPALTAKMIATLDVVSGGRAVLGIGAGWKREEWLAYGYEFPETRDRLGALRDQLEVITRMLAPGRATYEGRYARVDGAINLPRGLQEPRVPIMVGGNGPEVTWRLAARFADELNLDSMPVDEIETNLPVIAARCEEVGRDPGTLAVSLHIWADQVAEAGPPRVERLQRCRELGLSRVQCLLKASVDSDEALESFAADCRAAGVSLDG
ncbi:MAG: TIGR03560 family F420-dependent LLM class oxidoreductase [Chloroflexota bacterium]|nr:TIGR03560 family F420-dependent LLM class oxidoreductase [Chloroflexota bacterium]